MLNHIFLPSTNQFRTIPLRTLDFPDPFISSLYHCVDANLESLTNQVKQFGLIQPLPVHRVSEQTYQLLAGYSYLPILRQCGYKEAVCQIMPEVSEYPRYVLQICHGLSTVRTSPILQAYLLKTASHSLAENELMQLLVLMGFKPQRYKVQELIALLDLSPASIFALHQGILAPKTGKLLARLSNEDQDVLTQLIEKYSPGGSKQQKLVEMLIELSIRHQQSINALLMPWFELQRKDEPTNLPQQLQGLLRYLHEQSFPHLTNAEKQFQRLPLELALPANVGLHHSSAFEDESLELSIQCENLLSLKKLWQRLAPLLSNSSNG